MSSMEEKVDELANRLDRLTKGFEEAHNRPKSQYEYASACKCDLFGSRGSSCDQETGQCDCFSNFLICEHCSEGLYNFPNCEECGCLPAGTKAGMNRCNMGTGQRVSQAMYVTSGAKNTTAKTEKIHLDARANLMESLYEPWKEVGCGDTAMPVDFQLSVESSKKLAENFYERCKPLLPEELAVDAEKVLHSLVCVCTDRRIKKRFIEACIENLANHRFSHKDEVTVQLMFLAGVFSSTCSTDNFRLNLDQVEMLWSCLATDAKCCDDWLNWVLNQAKSKNHHALGLDTFKHLFLEKMPGLRPESMSMIGLTLFQQLSNLSRIANASSDNTLPEDKMGLN
ncbi:UBP34-like protein [Mya arenaria]|uniref:UBP34-like protein n=1 Tax=Mya arenaria TaxID=6604 RepID=A0ABY7DFR5_MYAAR|nr:UBP34-like protein [Mya arenaria]